MKKTHAKRFHFGARGVQAGMIAMVAFLAAGCGGDEKQGSQTGRDVDWAQQSRYALEAYEASFIDPAGLDAFLSSRPERYATRDFDECLDRIQERLLRPAVDHAEVCDKLGDPTWVTQCVQENDPAEYRDWARALQQVLQDGRRWTDTDLGRLTLLSKQMIDQQLGPGTWSALAQEAARQTRPVSAFYLSCQD